MLICYAEVCHRRFAAHVRRYASRGMFSPLMFFIMLDSRYDMLDMLF